MLVIEKSREQTRNVCFDNGHGLIEREGCDSVCRITADPGQFANGGKIAWEPATMSILHNPRSGVEIVDAAVVAESLPSMQDVIFRGSGQRGEIGEATEPLIIIWDNGSHPSLMKHELGDEDGVGVARVTPGKIAAVLAMPAQKGATESGHVF